jgi:hypothetical protein
MRNTGYKRFQNVKEYYVSNDQPTGRVKPNPPSGQPDHAIPVLDTNACPLPGIVTSMEKREYMFREIDGPGDGDIYDRYRYPIIITTNTTDPNIFKYYYDIGFSNAYESFPSSIDVIAQGFTGTNDYGEILDACQPSQEEFLNRDDLVAAYTVDNYTFTF